MENEIIVETEQGKEKKTEQLNQKIAPSARKRLDEVLVQLGFHAESDGHVRWDQEKLDAMMDKIGGRLVMEEHEKYSDVVTSINQYTTLINAKLISLISDLDTTEARIRSEYEEKLSSKDSIIKELQDQRSAQENEKKSAIEDASKSKDEKTIAEKQRMDAEEKLKKAEDTVKDKDSIIQMLTSRLTEADEKLSGYDALRSSEASLKEQVSTILHQKELTETRAKFAEGQHAEAQSKCEDLEKQIEKLQGEKAELHDQVKMLQRDVEEQKRLAAQSMEEQKKAADQELALAVERAVQKAKEEMREEATKAEKEFRDQITALREEKTRLTVQLEMIQKNTNTK